MHVVCVAVLGASRLAIWSETRMAHWSVGASELVGSSDFGGLPENSAAESGQIC